MFYKTLKERLKSLKFVPSKFVQPLFTQPEPF